MLSSNVRRSPARFHCCAARVFVSLADAQEEKLVIITTEINAKQKCLEMLENARKRSDLIRQRYEERIKLLSDRIQAAEDEKQTAVTKLSTFVDDRRSFTRFFVV